jgi:hypothetical protein
VGLLQAAVALDRRSLRRALSERAATLKTMITLGMAEKGMTMLEVACRRCDRRGRLSIARLIAEHGRDDYGDLR